MSLHDDQRYMKEQRHREAQMDEAGEDEMMECRHCNLLVVEDELDEEGYCPNCNDVETAPKEPDTDHEKWD